VLSATALQQLRIIVLPSKMLREEGAVGSQRSVYRCAIPVSAADSEVGR
jgi:hypothetical protein